MPFVPHTPESLIPRSDSKNAATTCKGITSGGRPCRRGLNGSKSNNGVLAVVSRDTTNNDGAAAFFCWQHKDQADGLVSKGPSTGAANLYTLNERTSVDTLVERLGILDVEDGRRKRRTQPKPANKQGLPQKWQDVPGPLLAVSTSEKVSNRRIPRQRQQHSLLSFLCCGSLDDHESHPARPRPVAKESKPEASNTAVPGKQQPHKSDRRPSSSARPEIKNPTNPHSRPPLPRDPTSQTEGLLALIPKTLSPQTTSLLLAELAKPVSPHDEEGYIYMFWLTPTGTSQPASQDPSTLLSSASPMPSPRARRTSSTTPAPPQSQQQTILLKIGRASNVQRRMNEWTRQCGYDLSLIRFYPYLPSSSSPAPSPLAKGVLAANNVAAPRKVPHAHKVERLIHLELAERRVKRDCGACGKEHREWFEVGGDREGVRGVDEVIRRWVRWAEMRG
ncbi:MAG: hypothetical protein Q9220_002208 [cf. Caloplaca sp. 1 TL-2023]